MTLSLSYTFSEGISPEIILQKMQSILYFLSGILSADHIFNYIGKSKKRFIDLGYICDTCHSCIGLSAAFTAGDSRDFFNDFARVCTLCYSFGACDTKEVAFAV